jgi:hypothetical protein
MHAFAGTTRTFFTPAFSAGSRLFLIKKLLSKILHVTTVLYTSKTGGI